MTARGRARGYTRPFWVLMAVAFMMHLGGYLIIPVLPVYLGSVQGLSVSEVGWILGVGNAAFLAGCLGGGLLADHWGRRNLMAAGTLLMSAAMAGYAISSSFASLAVSSITNGVGTGLLAPALKARIADEVPEAERTRAFSVRGIAANAGIIAAGLAITALVLTGDRRVFWYAAAVQLVLTAVTLAGLRRDRPRETPPRSFPLQAYRGIFKHKSFVLFSAASLLIWALYAQFALVMPLRAAHTLGGSASLGLIWTINSLAVVLIQGPLSRFVLERFSPFWSLAAGTLFAGSGLFLIGWAERFAELSGAAVMFVLGEMLLLPVIDTLTGDYAKAEWMGAYFGIANVVAGIGNALGTTLGGMMVERLGGVASPSPWLAYGIFTLFLVSLLGLYAVYAAPRHRTGERPRAVNAQIADRTNGTPRPNWGMRKERIR